MLDHPRSFRAFFATPWSLQARTCSWRTASWECSTAQLALLPDPSGLKLLDRRGAVRCDFGKPLPQASPARSAAAFAAERVMTTHPCTPFRYVESRAVRSSASACMFLCSCMGCIRRHTLSCSHPPTSE